METEHPDLDNGDRTPRPRPRPQQQRARGKATASGRKWFLPVVVLIGLVIAGVVWGLLQLIDDDGDDSSQTAVTTQSDSDPDVVIIDESEVDVVQNPSLKGTVGDGEVTIENDGNVTMHDITVTEDGEEVCELPEMAPGDSEVCSGVSGAATISGLGPQDQPVEVSPG